HTAWVDGDEDYERRLVAFAEEARAAGELKALVDTAVNHNREAIRATLLGQKLLQLMLPGVPDTYQGTEVVNLSLVDPDNRRPVDYGALRARLAALRENGPRDLDDEKLLVTTTALRVRREQPDAFAEGGDYQPLTSESRHLLGFVRGREVAVLATRAPQRLEAAGGWGGATVRLAEGLWRDELTQTLHGGGEYAVADLLATYPVALLRRVHMT
ncbi:MAG: malto-oligosyltrehalose synthase, partial [Nocardioidaceae bacterium]